MRSFLAVCLLLAATSLAAQSPDAASTSASNTETIPVVVAIDTSRSLTTTQLAEVVDRLRLALADLDADTPTGLLSFDDQPRWVLEPEATPEAVQRALQELTPRGDFTLLNDALFVAARSLDGGGIILLATDGRDENSATTVEDIARRCEAQGIRILPLGSGRSVERRFLRRLALLTGGDYIGDVITTDASIIAAAVHKATGDLAQSVDVKGASLSTTDRAVRPSGAIGIGTTETESSANPSQSPSSSSTTGSREGISPWYTSPLWAAGVVLLLALLAFLLGRRLGSKSSEEEEIFDVPDLIPEGNGHMTSVDSEIEERLATFPIASMDEAPEVTVDTAVFYGSSLEDRLEKTRVLTDRGVLISRRADDSPRLYLLSFHKAFAVGRSREDNTLAIPDPALSSIHFRVVPDGHDYYLLDLNSTNGSYLNGHNVHSSKLNSGDVIRAGQVEFEFQSQTDALG